MGGQDAETVTQELVHSDWVTIGQTSVRGSGFVDGEYHTSNELAARLDDLESAGEFTSFLDSINGFFAVVTGGDLQAFAVDHIQSIPLYFKTEPSFQISDDAHQLARDSEEHDEELELEYLLVGYVTGLDTVHPDIRQLLPGRIGIVEDGKLSVDHWFRFSPETTTHSSRDALLDKIDRVLEESVERLVRVADGRQITVALSSGYDSRVILELLRRLGYDNLLAFTFGDEIDAVREHVDLEGLDWVPIEHSMVDYREWYHSENGRDFERTAGYLDRVPRIHMALSMAELEDQGHLDDDALLVTGDAVQTTGEHIPDNFLSLSEISVETVVDNLLHRHYRMWEWPNELDSFVRTRARGAVPSLAVEERETIPAMDATTAIEEWDWQERQSKYMLQNYFAEVWGRDWWFPLWDRDFVAFWESLPVEHRHDKSLFKHYVERILGVQTEESKLNKFVSRLESRVKDIPLIDPIARFIYYGNLHSTEYGDHPGHGILTEDQFNKLQSGNQGLHVFQALHVMDRINFIPPENHYPPIDGVIYPRSHYEDSK